MNEAGAHDAFHFVSFAYINVHTHILNYYFLISIIYVGRKDKLEKKTTKIKTSFDDNACVIPQSVKDLKISLIQ